MFLSAGPLCVTLTNCTAHRGLKFLTPTSLCGSRCWRPRSSIVLLLESEVEVVISMTSNNVRDNRHGVQEVKIQTASCSKRLQAPIHTVTRLGNIQRYVRHAHGNVDLPLSWEMLAALLVVLGLLGEELPGRERNQRHAATEECVANTDDIHR